MGARLAQKEDQMSEFENENEETIDDNEVTEESEAIVAEGETEDQDGTEAANEAPSEKKDEKQDPNDVLFDKTNKAARLLRARRAVLRKQQEENAGKSSVLVRALKLLELKPKMEQKEIAELLGVRLRELDAVMAEAEKDDIVARIEPDEPDMRKVVIMADDDALARAEAKEAKGEDLVPGLAEDDLNQLVTLLDKVIDPLVALGLDEERESFRGGRGDRGDRRGGHDDRGGFRGGRDNDRRGGFRGGRDDRGASHGGSRGGDRNDRGGFRGGRDDRGGSRGGYRGSRDDRGGFRGSHDDRGSSRGYNGSSRGYNGGSRGNDRGGYRGNSRDDRGGSRGGYRGGSSRY